MCSTKPVVDHLVLTETGSDNIGDVEINEWSELLTNEHEIAITRNNPVSLTAITESSRKINGKFKRAAEPITSTWNNRNSYSNNANNSFISRSFEGVPMDSLTSPPPPKLPPKSSNIINNLNLNGHSNIFNNLNGKAFSNNAASSNSSDWIELKTTNQTKSRNPTEKLSITSVGGLKKNGISTNSSAANNGNIIMRPPPPPPSTAPSQQNLSASIASNTSRKLSSTSSSSLSSSSMSPSMTLAVTCSPSSKEKCISVRNPHQDLPSIHIPSHSNHQRAMHSSSTGVSPTSSSSSSNTIGSSPSGVQQHPMSHSFNSSTLIQTRDCNGILSDAGVKTLSSTTNNFTNNVISNENYKPTAAGTSTTILSQLVSSSSSQKILVHQQHPSSITTTTVLSAISSSASGINAYHEKATKNNNAMQFVLSNTSSASPSPSSNCCNDTVANMNSNCVKEKIIRGKSNVVRNHNHHPLKTPSKNGSHIFMSESKKSPAPQPPILQQPVRPKMILIHQRSLEFNGADSRVENEDVVNFEFSSTNAITKQPTK